MTAPRSGQRWHATAAILLFVGLPCLLSGLTVMNGLAWLDASAARERNAERLVQFEQRIRSASARAERKLDTAPIFLTASSASLARAELQTRVTGLIDRVGGRLIEVRSEEDGTGGDPNSASVRFTFDAVHDRLVDLLTAIEAGLPLLSVETLNVRASQDRAMAATVEDPVLRVTLGLRGYRREAQL